MKGETHMKRFLALTLAAVLLLATLSGCSGSSATTGDDTQSQAAEQTTDTAADTTAVSTGKTRATSNGKAENSLTVAADQAPNTLDPELFSLQSEDDLIMQIYEPLLLVENDGSYTCILADSYTVNEDGSVDFVLTDAQFHSGDTVKSEDVEYALSRLANSPLLSALDGMIEMTITDDTHFHWEFPYADQGAGFDDLTAYIQSLMILNKSWAEERIDDPNDKLGLEEDGSGAYVLDSIADNGDVTLTRFENYHGEASIDTIYFKLITGDTEMAFEAGDIDYSNYTKSTFDVISAYDNVTTAVYNVNSVFFMMENCSEGEPTADLRVRQAIAYALNRDDVASISSADGGTTAYNMATPLVTYYTEDVNHYEQDLDKANELMTEAGYSSSNKAKLSLVILNIDNNWVSGAEIIKEQLEQSYFEVELEQTTDTTRFFTGNFDLGLIAVGLTPSFASYSMLFDSSTGMNLAMYEEPDVLEAFSAITDEASTQEAMRVVVDSMAYYPIYYPAYFVAYDSDLIPGEYLTSFNCYLFRQFSWAE
jgi:peptide/nickel transport system substrate-binding protein